MELTGLKIDGFGVWKNLEIGALSGGITALHGRNEAGKTTLMHFVRSVLYGYSPARRQRFLPPHHGGRPGGWLQAELPTGSVRLARYADADTTLGELMATDDDGRLPASTTLRTALGDIDEATFNNVYAIGLREIQELGTLSDTDAARWLYSLTTGLDRVSLLDVVRELESSRERLLSGDGRPSHMTELLCRRVQLQDEIDQLVTQSRRWSQITVKLQESGVEVERLEVERDRLELRARTIEIAIQVKPKWLQRIDLDRQLTTHEGRVRLPNDALKQLDELNQEIEEHERQQEVHKRQRLGLREQAEALGVNEMLVRYAARIEALSEQRDWLEALERQQAALTDELDSFQSQLASEHERLGFDLQSVNLDKKTVPEISEGLVNSLRPHAKAVRSCREQHAAAERDAAAKRDSEDEFRAQLAAAMPESVGSELPTDLEGAGELVANLRKRLHAEERLEQSRRQEVELQQQNHELLDRQESPLWMSAVLALLLLVGMVVLGWGISFALTPAKILGGVMLGMWGLWHLFKYLEEDQVSQRREECHRQIGLARTQIDSAGKEKADIDDLLGPVRGSVVVQLQTAERHLAELEKLLPVETRRREAQQEADTAARRAAEAERNLKAALSSWQNKLKGLGLPADMTPSDIRALAGRYEQITDLRLRVERRRGDVELRCREHSALCQRIRNLAEEVHLLLPDATPIAQLEHLESQLRQHWMRVEERDRLRTKAKKLKEAESRHARTASAHQNRRESTFVHAGAQDEAGFRLLFREQQQADAIREERATVCREITAAIGSHAPEQEIADLLGPESVGLLDRWWEEAAAELENVEEQLKEVVASRGALQQELKHLAEDRSLAERHLDLAAVEEQLKRAAAQWRARAATSLVLDEVRTRYEKERQPDTLVAASAHMKRLTGGAYQRIWTPLGKEILFVDNANGDSLAVEVLSRGTREQLFLSLRFALVSLLARRGVRLPMILDDVLVNFDEDRARQAVQVLADYAAEGHQLLVFTCHEHVYRMFHDLNLDTRRLPDRFGADEPSTPEVADLQIAPPAVEPAPTDVIETSYEYLLDEGEPEPNKLPVEVRVAAPPSSKPKTKRKPKPKRKPRRKRAPRPKPVLIAPPPPIVEVQIEPISESIPEPVVEPMIDDDEWIRIGPQVRHRDWVDRRTNYEIVAPPTLIRQSTMPAKRPPDPGEFDQHLYQLPPEYRDPVLPEENPTELPHDEFIEYLASSDVEVAKIDEYELEYDLDHAADDGAEDAEYEVLDADLESGEDLEGDADSEGDTDLEGDADSEGDADLEGDADIEEDADGYDEDEDAYEYEDDEVGEDEYDEVGEDDEASLDDGEESDEYDDIEPEEDAYDQEDASDEDEYEYEYEYEEEEEEEDDEEDDESAAA